MYPTTMGTTACANRSGSKRRDISSCTPVAIVAAANVIPTTAQNTTSAAVLSTSLFQLLSWMNCTQVVESLNESKAVEPKSTATTPTRPGRTGTPSRLPNGLRVTRRPSPRRPNTERWPTSVEYTSNGSARANHLSPNSAAPTSVIAKYTANHSLRGPRKVACG